MTLKDELDAVVKSAVSDMGEIRAELTALEHAMPAVCGRTGKVRQIMMTLATRLNSLKVIAAKEVMLGNEPQATRQDRPEEMELFATNASQCGWTQTRGAMLETLHRAGDHTLDDDEREEDS